MKTANPFLLPKTEVRKPQPRLVLPEPRDFPGDNVYMKTPPGPQAYIPYSPPVQKTYGGPCFSFVAKDTAMTPLAIVGLALTFALGLPVGLFTGPSSLKRAKRVEALVQAGRRPRSDLSEVTTARVCAWIGIVLSVPILLAWVLVLGAAVLMLAG